MNTKKKLTMLTCVSLLTFSMVVAAVNSNFLSQINAEDNPYTLTLNSSNAVTTSNSGEQTLTQKTDLGRYDVDFKYTNATLSTGNHCRLNENGKLVNKDHILSIGAFKVVYTTTGELQFRTSYDAQTWGALTTVTNNFEYSLPSHPYYIEFSSPDGYTDISSIQYKYTCEANPAAESTGSGEYTLINSTDDLEIGGNYVIAALNSNYAMSTVQNSNNRGQAAITKNNTTHTISWSSSVCEFEMRAGTKTNTYAFYDLTNKQYICAASSTKNYLRSENTVTDNSSFTISFNSGYAVITAQGTYTRNIIRYNNDANSGLLFSCYASGCQPVVLYKKMGGPVEAPVDEVGFTASDSNANGYQIGDTYSTDNGLVVKACFSDGSNETLTSDKYTYSIKNSENQVVSATSPFEEFGSYTVTVNYKNYMPVIINITVEEPTLSSIVAVLMEDEYLVTDTFSYTDNLLVDLTYSNGESVSNLEYDGLAFFDVAAKLVNPSGVEHDISEPFGVKGNWKVVVYSTENPSLFDECLITVKTASSGTSKVFQKVTQWSDIVVGDEYIIASSVDGVTAGGIAASTTYMSSVETTFVDDGYKIEDVPSETQIFTLGGSSEAYTFADEEGHLLGTTAAKKVNLNDTGTTTWDITLYTDETVDIDSTTSSNGSIYYNFSSPRFTTYGTYDSNNENYVELYHCEFHEDIYPTAISLNKSSMTIDMYQTSKLIASFTPSSANMTNVTWTSSNTSVATVSDGVVRGIAQGNATITATVKDANNQNLTATCNVIVNYAEEPVLTKTTMRKGMDEYVKNNIYTISAAPSSGNAKLLVIPVWFNDSSNYIDTSKKSTVRDDIRKAYFGTNSETGWRSVKTYYEQESHGAVTIDGVVSDWYEPGNNASYYASSSINTCALVESATNWYFNNNPSVTRKSFDCDGNGYLDGVMLIYAAPDYSAWGKSSDTYGNMWAYCYWLQDSSLNNKNNPGPNVFFWASFDFMYDSGNSVSSYNNGDTSHCNIDTHTYIHEMGHVFGLEDYYDYSNNYKPAGGFSMQDYNVGGHDPYSCLQLGWTDAYIPTTTVTLTINDFQSSGDLVILTPAWNNYDSPFDEYILVELYTPTGLNELDSTYTYDSTYPKGPNTVGIRVWHVDARLLYVTSASSEAYTFNASQITVNPSYNCTYGVTRMMSNTYYSSQKAEYCSPLGQTYADYNELQLIRKNTSTTYKPTSTFSSSDLFVAGNTFSMNTYASQFKYSGKLNQNLNLGWSFTVNSITGNTASITFTKQ